MERVESAERPSWTSWAWPAAFAAVAVLFLIVPVLPGGLVPEGPLAASGYFAVLAALVIGVLAWALWATKRQRVHYEQRLEQWAKERAIQQERLRIARDLHDLASHGLGIMTVRAATAKLTDDETERLMALDDIERIGRSSTAELRRMLSILRDQDAADAPMRPADSLNDLPDIIDTARRAGLRVTIEQEHDVSEVSAGVQVTICAVIREALANALRHAGATTAHVRISTSRQRLRVDVRDHGPSPGWQPHPGTGHGLAGLRERVELHGGTLTTGPVEHGYRVTAELPIDDAP